MAIAHGEVIQMISEHPSFEPPADRDVSVWRYMDLAKFLWMLQKNALFFARADQLGDPYEGHYTEPYVESLNRFMQELTKNPSNRMDEQQAREFATRVLTNHLTIKKEAFVNCWHMNEEESAAMWKLYTSHHQSVCVRSTYRQLAEQLPGSCKLGQIKYVDYRQAMIPSSNVLNFINYKRRSYAHERELRAVIWSKETENVQGETRPLFRGQTVCRSGEEIGKVVPVDLQNLISGVLVSPSSDDNFREIVQGLCDVYGLAVEVLMSGANAPPAF
jgi:hypothetical protein